MKSYLDIGFDDNLTPNEIIKRDYIDGINSDTFIEGVDSSQMMTLGSFGSPRGNWQIGFDDEQIVPQQDASYNRSVKYKVRIYKSIVATDGSGDYDNLQEAIDYVERNGGGAIFVASGTYYPTDPIVITSNVQIIGENRYSTIFDFSNATFADNGCFQVRGTDVSSSGSITVTNGSAGVTGSSTSFVTDNVKEGDIILINNAPYEVASVTSGTVLTLTETYRGETTSSLPTRIYRPKENIEIVNITVKNGLTASAGEGNGIEIFIASSVTVSNCICENNVDGIEASNTFDFTLDNCIFRYNSSDGIRFGGSGSIYNNTSYNNLAAGLNINASSKSAFANVSENKFIGNGTVGVYLFISDGVTLNDNYISSNLEYGVWLQGATFNKIDNNYIYNNGNDGIRVEARIVVDSEDNLISNNYLRENDGHAIELTSGSIDNFIHGNMLRSNTTNSILDNGTTNTLADNN